MPSLTELIDSYGYVAVVLGTFLEGETVLVLAGFAAHQGYLDLEWVIVAALSGSLSGDQLAFFAGRRYGAVLLKRFPRLRSGVARATALLERHEVPLLLGFRFVYGIRNVTPIAAGLSGIAIPRFVILNVLGAALWAATISTAGYLFGHAFGLLLERARAFEFHAMLVLLALGLTWFAVRAIRRRRRRVAPPA